MTRKVLYRGEPAAVGTAVDLRPQGSRLFYSGHDPVVVMLKEVEVISCSVERFATGCYKTFHQTVSIWGKSFFETKLFLALHPKRC